MKTGALIIAIKASEQLEEISPLLTIGDTSIIKKVIVTLQQQKIDPIVVVTGEQGDNLEKHISKRGVIFLRKDDYEKSEMFDAVCMGINYIKNLCDRVLIMPGKTPIFSEGTILKILEGKGSIVCPTYKGKKGHPIMILKDMLNKILEYKGEYGLNGAINSLGENIEIIEVDDESILMVADSKAMYEKVKKKAVSEKTHLRYNLQIRVARDEIFFGPGIAQFLMLVKHTSSMHTACRQMHMSYSKGLKMLNQAEKELGVPLVIRQVGGAEGGSSSLTETGENILYKYLQMEIELKKRADELFIKYFKELEEV